MLSSSHSSSAKASAKASSLTTKDSGGPADPPDPSGPTDPPDPRSSRDARSREPIDAEAHRGAHLEVIDLCKEYRHGDRTVPVLRDVHLTLQPGDMAAIMGASGVGKSTLLHVLGTLDLPTSGTLRFNGRSLTAMTSSQLAEFRNREIGFVFQFHHLLPEFTALENVMMPALIQRMTRRSAARRASDILGRVGLSHRLTHKPSQLSGGEQQRVALARAMILEPSLLLADEPTGNLDRRTGEEIHELFLELNHERGSTLLVVTHNPELAKLMPRCLKMLDEGGLEELSVAHAHVADAHVDDPDVGIDVHADAADAVASAGPFAEPVAGLDGDDANQE